MSTSKKPTIWFVSFVSFVSFALRDTGLILYRLYLYPLGEIHAIQARQITGETLP